VPISQLPVSPLSAFEVVYGLTLEVYEFTLGSMASALDLILDGFTRELLSEIDVEKFPPAMGEEELRDLGRRAAQAAVAPLLWSGEVSERWDVRRVTKFLDISRQAVYKRARTGSLLGLQGAGTTWFPVWQFDPDGRVVRPVVASIIEAFRKADPEVDPLVIAAWATARNRYLGGASPAEVVAGAGEDEHVVLAAARAARGLAA